MKTVVKVVICFMLSLIITDNVYASSSKYNGYIKESTAISNIYFYKHREDTSTIKYPTHNQHTQAHILRRTSDNQVAYCVEPFSSLTGATNTSYTEYLNDYSKLGLSSTQIINLENLIYYGYGYKDSVYNHTSNKWYAITQYLIWREVSPSVEVYFVSSISSTTPLNTYSNEIKELSLLVESKSKLPLLNNPKEIKALSSISLVDQNKVLNDFKVSSVTKAEAEVVNNNLNIKSTDIGAINLTLETNRVKYSERIKYYYSANYQDCVSLGNPTPRSSSYYINALGAGLTIKKYGVNIKYNNGIEYEYIPLSGIYYDVYNESGVLVKTLKIKNEGIGLTTYSIPKGIYFIKERASLEGYELDTNTYEIKVTEEDYGSLVDLGTKYNYQEGLSLFNVDITKLKEDYKIINNNLTYDYYPESNKNICLKNKEDLIIDNKIIIKDTCMKEYKTNEKGKVLDNIYLPKGIYYTSYNEQVYNLVDTIKEDINKFTLTIHNYIKNTTIPISNTEINFYNADNSLDITLITNQDGIITLSLPNNIYYFKEQKINKEYILDNSINKIEINNTNKEINIYNTKIINNSVTVPDTLSINKKIILKYIITLVGTIILWPRKIY